MKVNVKYFASIRETIGVSSEELQTSAINLGQLRAELIARGHAYAESLAQDKAVRMALNQTLVDAAAVLHEGCEVAFFPPVTGG